MIHRYLAMTVGVLILALAVLVSARGAGARVGPSPCVGLGDAGLGAACRALFGAYTVTLKLYPAIVTRTCWAAWCCSRCWRRSSRRSRRAPLRCRAGARRGAGWWRCWRVQIALGGWVSTNYAVLACREFPHCHGQWWPPMDFGDGFTLLRELGRAAAKAATCRSTRWSRSTWCIGCLPLVVLAALLALAWRLWRDRGEAARPCGGDARWACWRWQLLSGLATWCSVGRWWRRCAHRRRGGAVVALLVACWSCAPGQAGRGRDRWLVEWRAAAAATPEASCMATTTPSHPAPLAGLHGAARAVAVAVLRADQAARGAADRVLRRDRHAAGRARPARLARGAAGDRSASGWWPAPRPRSTAWSSSRSIAQMAAHRVAADRHG